MMAMDIIMARKDSTEQFCRTLSKGRSEFDCITGAQGEISITPRVEASKQKS